MRRGAGKSARLLAAVLVMGAVLPAGAVEHPADVHGSSAPWQSYGPAHAPAAARAGEFRALPTDSPAYHRENLFGYPVGQDPLFDRGNREPWNQQHLQRPVYDRPAYERPGYTAPILRESPVRKPAYEQPFSVLPNDDRPKYDFKHEQAPAYRKPSFERPAYERPGYVIHPEPLPAYHKPTYDEGAIRYDRPHYDAPVYTPQEYRPPRELPPPYINPPR